MAYLAYIIGEIPEKMTALCQQKFENAQFILESNGFRVFNPIKNLINKKIKVEDAKKINIRQFLNCNVAYVLSSVSLENVKKSGIIACN